jgi:hypothetical protein
MNAAPSGPPVKKWTWTRWFALVAVVLAIHVGFIIVFGARKLPVPVPVKNAPSLMLAGGAADGWISLNDATLFSLPNENGFAGQMWITLPHAAPFQKTDWTEKPRWLAETDSLSRAEMVAPFYQFTKTNQFVNLHFEYNLPPQLMVPMLPSESPFASGSSLQIEGDIAKRGLLNVLNLPTLPSGDVIPPSRVQVLVDAAGHVVSAVLLPPENFVETSPLDKDSVSLANARALDLARVAQFAPLTPGAERLQSNPTLPRLGLGVLIFNWQTTPKSAASNAVNNGNL